MKINLDQARTYLASLLPWPEEHEPGYINIHWTSNRPDRDRPVWSGRACRTVEEALRTIRWAGSLPETRDIYACQSRQAKCEDKISKKGKPYKNAVRSQENALALKSFFIDIDVKDYNNPTEAIKATQHFLFKIGNPLPLPTLLVGTGNGWHVYWTLAMPVELQDWQPIANALAETTKQHGLKCDTAVTIDAARVLRVPGTENLKDPANPKPVTMGQLGNTYTLARLAGSLHPYIVANPSPAGSLPRQGALQGQSDLAAGVEALSAQPVDMKSLIAECPFLMDALVTAGKTYSNPLWSMTTLCATFIEKGRDIAHLMARGHPGYTRESTDELFARKQKEVAEKGVGWPSCRAIHAFGAAQCATCPHITEGKSPLNFGRRIAPPSEITQRVTPSDLPDNYVRDKDTLKIFKVTHNTDGTQVLHSVCGFAMYEPWIQTDPVWVLNFKTHTNREVEINLPTSMIGSQEMRKHLQAQGFMLRSHAQVKLVEDFTVAWITKLRDSKEAIVSTAPFGWAKSKGVIDGFAYAGKVWMKEGHRLAPTPTSQIRAMYDPEGFEEPWHDAATLITQQKRPALNALLASSFGAPLVRFTNMKGLLMSAYSAESGIGKSSALIVAASVWGSPRRSVGMLDDTTKSLANLMGTARSLPVYWDELKTKDEVRKFVSLVFQLGQGRERHGMNPNMSRQAAGEWNTLLVAANNDSILDAVVRHTNTNEAGLYRVFEYTVPKVPKGSLGQIDLTDASRIIARCDDNYGHVGIRYAQFLGANAPRIESEVSEYFREINKEVDVNNEERNWTAVISAICMGARYAGELGLCNIDEVELREFMIGVLARMRGERVKQAVNMNEPINVSNILARYIDDKRAEYTLWTNVMWLHQGKPPANIVSIVQPADRIRGIHIRVNQDDKTMIFVESKFKQWLREQDRSPDAVFEALYRDFGVIDKRLRIGAGTRFANSSERCMVFDLTRVPELNFIDEA